MTADELAALIEQGDIDAVAAALQQEPSLISTPTTEGDLPLHIACWHKQIQILGVLFPYGPDVNARGLYQRTPLHYAVHEGGAMSVPIVSELLARGADPSLKDQNGFSVEDWAKTEMVDSLPDVLALLRKGRTP